MSTQEWTLTLSHKTGDNVRTKTVAWPEKPSKEAVEQAARTFRFQLTAPALLQPMLEAA